MKRLIIVLLLGLVAALIHLQLFFSSWGDKLEPLALDLWFNIRGTVTPPNDVVLVSMDESSYQVLNVPLDKAWPRSLHAELLKRLKNFGVRRVAMDILFIDPSSDPKADQALAEAIKMSPTVIGADEGTVEQANAAGRFSMDVLMTPLDAFANNAEQIALVKLPDDFGYLRRFYIERNSAAREVPQLYEAAAGPKIEGEKPGPRDFIWYYGPTGTIPTYPYHQLFNEKGSLPPSILKDKIVFVGLNLRSELGPSQKDSYRTPFYKRGSMFGVEIQATATANLLTHKWIKRAGEWTEGLLLSLVTFLVTVTIFYLRPQYAGLVLVGTILAWFTISYFAFLGGLFIPGVILVAVILPVAYLGSTLAYYLITHRREKQVERAFQMYLSPEMARQMKEDPTSLGLGGDNLFATALFTDIEGFTAITEGMLASEVAHMLNSYFTEVMGEIFENKGTLIKFIGDAVFALWGAPVKIPDHARMACETAIAIQKAVRKFNDSKRFPPLNTRIGINTGPMVVGNLGSTQRFDYTAIGDSVNLASRLEGINKNFGTQILISESTKKELGSKYNTLSLGKITVVGKSELIEVFALLEQPIAPEIDAIWNKALTRFRLRDWDEAANLFEEARQREARLKASAELYLARVKEHKLSQPKDTWQGEVEFSSK